MESEVMRGPGTISTGGNIFHWLFLFSCSKTFAANIAILEHFGKKTLMGMEFLHLYRNKKSF